MRSKWSLIFILLFVLVTLVGCSNITANKAYGKDDNNITVEVGQTFTIQLEENATTGYSWTVSISDDIVNVEKDSYVEDPKDNNLVGAGGLRIFTFKGISKGTTMIELSYERSFEENSAIETLQYNVIVN